MPLNVFALLCKAHGLPQPMPEWKFHPKRKWRFDWAFVPAKIAVEQNGSIWTQGRHTRGAGYLKDCEKRNFANLDGWCVFEFSPQQIESGEWVPLVRSALERRWPDQPMEGK